MYSDKNVNMRQVGARQIRAFRNHGSMFAGHAGATGGETVPHWATRAHVEQVDRELTFGILRLVLWSDNIDGERLRDPQPYLVAHIYQIQASILAHLHRSHVIALQSHGDDPIRGIDALNGARHQV